VRRLKRTFLSLKPGEKTDIVEWRGKPVWIMRRTPEQLAAIAHAGLRKLADPKSERKPESSRQTTPATAMPLGRSSPKSSWPWVFARIWAVRPLTSFTPGPQPSLPRRLGKVASSALAMVRRSIWPGRVFKNVPAPDNLEVPPHMYLSDSKLLIGEDKKA
jgi:ubiquinol-cytochrome c reductase iron-sulfur subunit